MKIIEVIALSSEDAKRIEECGADRIELIRAPLEGGLTPDTGLVESVVSAVKIPVNVMIRPHSRSFVYAKEEIAVMKRDILAAKKRGANGVVLGVLNKNGNFCAKRLGELLGVCGGLSVTFHRAIDETRDIVAAVKALSRFPAVTAVLTSGGKGNIRENTGVLKEIIKNSGHIALMAGGGLDFENIGAVIRETGAAQYHFGRAVRQNASYSGEIDANKLRRMVEICKTA